MITVSQASELVKKTIQPTQKIQSCKVINALGFVLAKDVISPINMPPFRQSAMDGYALNMHANSNYNIIDEVKAGDGHHPTLKKGEAVRIFTGAAVPDSSDTVIMQEKVSASNNILTINETVNKNENIRPKGEQIKKGEVALKKGTKINPSGIGFLQTLGITEIEVFEKPKIGIVITGSELIKPGEELPYGKIYESNSEMLLAGLNSIGFKEFKQYSVEDNYKGTLDVLGKAISENDVLLISGGISVGDYDFVGKVLLELGTKQVFYKVKQKPGKPLFFGTVAAKPIFALPGNPASALSGFYVYVHTALERISGNLDFKIKKGTALLANDFVKKGNRAQFLKAHHEDGMVTILEGQSSAMLHTFAIANALVYIPWDINNYQKGEQVSIIHLPY